MILNLFIRDSAQPRPHRGFVEEGATGTVGRWRAATQRGPQYTATTMKDEQS